MAFVRVCGSVMVKAPVSTAGVYVVGTATCTTAGRSRTL